MTTKPTYPPPTDPNQLTFKVSVSNITPTTAEITVSPSNETKSYFSDIVTDADWLESQKHGFDDYLQYFIEVVMMEQQEILEKTKKLQVPQTELDPNGPDMIQQLVWGETGTFVRRLLWEEENE